MKHIRSSEAREIKSEETCVVTEYALPNSPLDIAKAAISGRYPETGSVQNKISTEVCLVTRGEGSITVNGERASLNTGDVILIEPGEQFFWEGDMDLVISCTPPWSPDQYQHDFYQG